MGEKKIKELEETIENKDRTIRELDNRLDEVRFEISKSKRVANLLLETVRVSMEEDPKWQHQMMRPSHQ